jgi:hypothetical protein
MLKTIVLPRQARDKHRESTPNKGRVSAGRYFGGGHRGVMTPRGFASHSLRVFLTVFQKMPGGGGLVRMRGSGAKTGSVMRLKDNIGKAIGCESETGRAVLTIPVRSFSSVSLLGLLFGLLQSIGKSRSIYMGISAYFGSIFTIDA